ncbi:MAG: Kazal-type serine protease inhibitor family protein, partial [Flavobacteriales bacterium]
ALSYDWTMLSNSGINLGSSTSINPTFSLPNPMNSDTNYICLVTAFNANPILTVTCNICDTVIWNGTSWMLLSMIPTPCNLTGGSVYIDHTNWMMNATVNGMSQYSYVWSNGGSANQTQFYTSWCVTITDIISGCDTTICQDCIPDSNALCMCTMIYMPVCGCDGNMYSNSCLADCADVAWTPAVSNGMPGGFLPCNTQQPCVVDINNGTVDIEICNGDTANLEATTGFDTYLWTETLSGLWFGGTPSIYVWDPGTYIVVATDSMNNCVDMDSIEVIVYSSTPLNPMTVPNPPEICLGDSLVIELTQGLSHYYWNTGNPLHQDEDRIVVFPTQDFTYVVEALDVNGCEYREEIEVFVDTCVTGMNSEMFSEINIYPNPTSDKLYIDLPQNKSFKYGRKINITRKRSFKFYCDCF